MEKNSTANQGQRGSSQVSLLTCPSHGPYVSFSFGGAMTACATCRDEERLALFSSTAVSPDRTIRDERMEARLSELGVPDRFLRCEFQNYHVQTWQHERVFDVLHSYAQTFVTARADGTNMILYGNEGTGKTHLGVALVRDLHQKGYSARYLDASKGAPLGHRNSDLVVLDNVGDTRNQSQRTGVLDFLTARYESSRPTVIIGRSGLDRGELYNYLGSRVVDRLREGSAPLLNLYWPSYRTAQRR